MQFEKSNIRRVPIASLLALVCFGLSYLAPHPPAAIAATPSPHPMFSEGNPGGFGHGLVTIRSASTAGLTAPASWPCMKSARRDSPSARNSRRA